jgi:hypothetical protein
MGQIGYIPMDQAATLMGDGIILQQKSLEPAELSGARSTRIELDASLLRGGSIMNYGLQVSFKTRMPSDMVAGHKTKIRL